MTNKRQFLIGLGLALSLALFFYFFSLQDAFAVIKQQEKELIASKNNISTAYAVAGYQEIKIGRHGIVLKKNNQSAVYLPQVAPEQGWDLPQTLTHLAQKAGLPPDAWKENAEFLVFEAEVFSEHDFPELTIPSPQKNAP